MSKTNRILDKLDYMQRDITDIKVNVQANKDETKSNKESLEAYKKGHRYLITVILAALTGFGAWLGFFR